MLELVISACMSTLSPAVPECRDSVLIYDAREVSLMTCIVAGQSQVAVWKETHRDWDVRRWSCNHSGVRQAKA